MKAFILGKIKGSAERSEVCVESRVVKTYAKPKYGAVFASPLKVTSRRSDQEIIEAFRAGRIAEI